MYRRLPAGKGRVDPKGVVEAQMPARRRRYDFFSRPVSPWWFGVQASACQDSRASQFRANLMEPIQRKRVQSSRGHCNFDEHAPSVGMWSQDAACPATGISTIQVTRKEGPSGETGQILLILNYVIP